MRVDEAITRMVRKVSGTARIDVVDGFASVRELFISEVVSAPAVRPFFLYI